MLFRVKCALVLNRNSTNGSSPCKSSQLSDQFPRITLCKGLMTDDDKLDANHITFICLQGHIHLLNQTAAFVL